MCIKGSYGAVFGGVSGLAHTHEVVKKILALLCSGTVTWTVRTVIDVRLTLLT